MDELVDESLGEPPPDGEWLRERDPNLGEALLGFRGVGLAAPHETRRVLAPGGRVAIMGILKAATPRGRHLQRFLATGGLRFFEPDQVASLLDHAGLDPDPLLVHGAVFFAGATRR